MFYPGKSLSNSITESKVVFTLRNVTATLFSWPDPRPYWDHFTAGAGIVS